MGACQKKLNESLDCNNREEKTQNEIILNDINDIGAQGTVIGEQGQKETRTSVSALQKHQMQTRKNERNLKKITGINEKQNQIKCQKESQFILKSSETSKSVQSSLNTDCQYNQDKDNSKQKNFDCPYTLSIKAQQIFNIHKSILEQNCFKQNEKYDIKCILPHPLDRSQILIMQTLKNTQDQRCFFYEFVHLSQHASQSQAYNQILEALNKLESGSDYIGHYIIKYKGKKDIVTLILIFSKDDSQKSEQQTTAQQRKVQLNSNSTSFNVHDSLLSNRELNSFEIEKFEDFSKLEEIINLRLIERVLVKGVIVYKQLKVAIFQKQPRYTNACLFVIEIDLINRENFLIDAEIRFNEMQLTDVINQMGERNVNNFTMICHYLNKNIPLISFKNMITQAFVSDIRSKKLYAIINSNNDQQLI